MTGQPKVANPQIKVGGEAQEIAVNGDTNKIYIYNPINGTVSVINSNSGSPVKNIRVGKYSSGQDLTPGSSSMAIDFDDNKIYVANSDSNTVSVIDAVNDSVIARISVGKHPISIAVDTWPIHPKIYVANENNTVSVIDASNDKKKPRNIVWETAQAIYNLRIQE